MILRSHVPDVAIPEHTLTDHVLGPSGVQVQADDLARPAMRPPPGRAAPMRGIQDTDGPREVETEQPSDGLGGSA